jgi:hypothetical protein
MVKRELEAVLVRHLGPVKAPPELAWRAGLSPGGTSAAPAAKAGQAKPQWLQPLAAGVAAVAAVAILFLWFRPPSSDLHSADPIQISAWLKSRSFDVPLRQDPPSVIRLTSAHIQGSTAEVDYSVAGHAAVLTISSPSAKAPVTAPYHVVRSHLVRGQLFTLACAFPQDAHTACLLCHMGSQVN